MKRIICLSLLLCLVSFLAACRSEPPALREEFEARFTAESDGAEYSGDLELSESGIKITMDSPETVRGITFDYSEGRVRIGYGSLGTIADIDHIPGSAVPSALRGTLSFIDQATYTGTENGEDRFSVPTPGGESKLTARDGEPLSLTDSGTGLTFRFESIDDKE